MWYIYIKFYHAVHDLENFKIFVVINLTRDRKFSGVGISLGLCFVLFWLHSFNNYFWNILILCELSPLCSEIPHSSGSLALFPVPLESHIYYSLKIHGTLTLLVIHLGAWNILVSKAMNGLCFPGSFVLVRGTKQYTIKEINKG